MSENLVRDIHDAVAASEIPAEASVRPSGTTSRELAAMRRDVLRKLAVAPDMSVLEIGCGVGLVGLPVARRAARYVGLDFAPQAVRAANRRFLETGLADKATAVDVDVLALGDTELGDLGRFDRVLAYAVLHYARSEQEAVRFLEVTHDLLESGGRALIGNLPLEDLQANWPLPLGQTRRPAARLWAVARWTASAGKTAVPLTRRWKALYVVQSAARGRSRDPAFVSPQLPPNYTLPLTTVAFDRWLMAFGDDLCHRWALPAPRGSARGGQSRSDPRSALNMPLAIPGGYDARWLSNSNDRETVERWNGESPDASVYHAASYIEFARAQNGSGDLLWLARNGNPVVGVPLHPASRRRFTTGYAGLLFPPGRRERPLREGVAAVSDLLRANRNTGLHVLQAAQSRAYDIPGRTVALGRYLEEQRVTLLPVYSRVLDLPDAGVAVAQTELGEEELMATGLEPYEPELRNQIRKAVRNGMKVTYELPADAAEVPAAYRDFVPLHRASWERTGMPPHDEPYWSALSRAVLGGGGRDLVMYVRHPDGAAAAAVVCHVRDGHALYWAGCSSEQGMRANANPLCLHAAIQVCRAIGVRRFELGRFHVREPSEKERAITRYKAQFGGELVRIIGFEGGSGPLAMLREQIARLRTRR